MPSTSESALSYDITSRLRVAPDDRELWGEFYRHLYSSVYYTAYKLARGDVALAKDVTHDAFLRFFDYGAVRRTPNDRKASAYLRQTARRLLFDRLHPREVTMSDEKLRELAGAEWHQSFDEEDRLQLEDDVKELAGDLSEEEAELLEDLLMGLPLKEMARKREVAYGTVAVRVHRLRQKIIKAIK